MQGSQAIACGDDGHVMSCWLGWLEEVGSVGYWIAEDMDGQAKKQKAV